MQTIIPPIPTVDLVPFGDRRLPERFWAKTQLNGETGCWEWGGQLSPKGYGLINLNRTMWRAHRAAYVQLVGAVADGLVLDHLCRIRNCVNPTHLEPVTPAENTRRGLINLGRKDVKLKPRTHCPQGHPYDEVNTATSNAGKRRCKACTRIRKQRYRRARVLPLHESPLARPTTIPQVFRAAARLLAMNGHYQGDYCPDAFDRVMTTPHSTRPLSIVAAIRCVASPHGDNPHRESELSELAVRVLAGRLEVDGEPAWNEEPYWLEMHVAAWGDVEGRTVESAVAVLVAAADDCEVAL
ncbi:HNH endonuclease signature motif containing protein [Streptomyces sp. NPDC004610]|uniref:HNH endonuclease signature motif containing protein n=1 Tax=unclassified Streptomyces TaxID=2593676 RepID=UPI0033B2E4C8